MVHGGEGRGVLSAAGIISHFALAGLKERDSKWKVIHPRILCQIHGDVVEDRRRRAFKFMEKFPGCFLISTAPIVATVTR